MRPANITPAHPHFSQQEQRGAQEAAERGLESGLGVVSAGLWLSEAGRVFSEPPPRDRTAGDSAPEL